MATNWTEVTEMGDTWQEANYAWSETDATWGAIADTSWSTRSQVSTSFTGRSEPSTSWTTRTQP